MTGFNPFQDVEGIVAIDVTTPEAAPLCLGSTYTFSQGQRQLISDYVAERFQGDVRNAFSALAPRLSPAQLPNWDLTLRARASEWANERVAGNALTERQNQAAAYFAKLLIEAGHSDASVNAELSRLPKAMRDALATSFIVADTRGGYNALREKLMTLVPALKRAPQTDTEPSDEAVFGEVKPGSTEPF